MYPLQAPYTFFYIDNRMGCSQMPLSIGCMMSSSICEDNMLHCTTTDNHL